VILSVILRIVGRIKIGLSKRNMAETSLARNDTWRGLDINVLDLRTLNTFIFRYSRKPGFSDDKNVENILGDETKLVGLYRGDGRWWLANKGEKRMPNKSHLIPINARIIWVNQLTMASA
jgi:hypothetical protein